MQAMPDLLMAKKNDGHPTDRADLFGKRLVVAIETEAGRRLSETMVKQLTGGDRIRARRMCEDPWEFSPTHTVVMATNHKPVIRGTDNGIWRRLKLIPFTVALDDEHADQAMPEKLRGEGPGILAWFVRGCLAWQEIGLSAPSEVTEATAEYRRDEDIIGAFLEENTVADPGGKVLAKDLYQRYAEWAKFGNEHVVTKKAFGMSMKERGFESRKVSVVSYFGIALKDPTWE
jgi:putative DNA primase/helicase